MELETRIAVLQNFSNEEWQELLTRAMYYRGPVIRVIVPEARSHHVRVKAAAGERLRYILSRLAEGSTRSQIACELGVSPGLVTKILKGERS